MGDETYDETAVVDHLVTHLNVLEPGLTLVGRNLHLPNAEGGKGFIDILARDYTGMFVVIEVKRSDSAAREAIHEILKYTDLLSRERKIPTARLRVIIASTTWHELLVPFSHAARISKVPLAGVHLDGATLGTELALEGRAVAPLDVQVEPEFSRVGVRVQLGSPDDTDLLWMGATEGMSEFGVDDGIGVLLRDDHGRLVLHIALGLVTPGDPRAVAFADHPIPALDIGSGRAIAFQFSPDEMAEGRTAVALVGTFERSEVAFAHELDRLVFADGWTVERVLRTGAFDLQGELVEDLELVLQATHRLGLSQVKFVGSARPAHALAWGSLRKGVAFALESNVRWKELVEAWLDEREREYPDIDVVVHIFNPMDLLSPVVFPERLTFKSMHPKVSLGIADSDGNIDLKVGGRLMWDGSEQEIHQAYLECYISQHGYIFGKAFGLSAKCDASFTESLGLTYELLEPVDDGAGAVTLELLPDGTLWRSAVLHDADTGIRRAFGGFVSAHLDQLNELREWVRVGIPAPSEIGQVPLVFPMPGLRQEEPE